MTHRSWRRRVGTVGALLLAGSLGLTLVGCSKKKSEDAKAKPVFDWLITNPGPLTPEEWVEMKMHPDIGFRMLSNIAGSITRPLT